MSAPAADAPAPWYDSFKGICEAIDRGLVGFSELRAARRAGYDRREKLSEWILLGRYWLDRCGNTYVAEERIHAPAVCARSAEYSLGTCSMLPIATGGEVCSRCGEAWTLRDAHDYHRPRGDSGPMHKACSAFAVQEQAREEFAAMAKGAGLDSGTLRAIPNRYGSGSWAGPWYLVASPMGDIRLGWRKRVIVIAWADGPDGRELFKGEPVTKAQGLVHAYGLADAQAYLERLLKAARP